MNNFGSKRLEALSAAPAFCWALCLVTFTAALFFPISARANKLELNISAGGFPSVLSTAIAKYQQDDAAGCRIETDQVTELVATHEADRNNYGALSRVGLEKVLLLAAVCQAEEAGPTTANLEAALQKTNAALKQRPGYGDARLVAGLLLGRLNRHVEAVAAFEEVLWFNKFSLLSGAQVQLELAKSLRVLGRSGEALTILSEAGTGSNDPAVLGELIEGLISAANKPEAVRVARLGLTANPANEQLETLLSEALLLSADRTLGIRDITEAKNIVAPRAEQAAEFTRAVGIYVRALTALNEFEPAHKVLNKLQRSSAASPDYQAALAQLKIEEQAAALATTELEQSEGLAK